MRDVPIALLHDLDCNNFSHTRPLGSLLQMCESAGELKLLIGDQREIETIPRSKFNRMFRPGGHASPLLAFEWAELFDDLAEPYERVAIVFDGKQVFSPILQRTATRVLSPFANDYELFLIATQEMAELHGYWVGVLDIENQYGSITIDQIFTAFNARELDVHPRLTDRVTTLMHDIGPGLLQGYATSDILSRLLLTLFDRWATSHGIPYIRYGDNIFVFQDDIRELGRLMRLCHRKLDQLGYAVSRDKRTIVPPHQVHWLLNGIVWQLPIEDYVQGPTSIFTDGMDSAGMAEGSGSPRTFGVGGLDILRLYKERFAPKHEPRSDLANRFVLRTMSQQYPEVLAKDIADLVRHRPSNAKYILATKEHDLLSQACSRAFEGMPSTEAWEDDAIGIIRSSPIDLQDTLGRRFYAVTPQKRAIRQAVQQLPSAGEAVVEMTARNRIDVEMWMDEKASFADLVHRTEGRVGRVCRHWLDRDPAFGLVFEMLDGSSAATAGS